LRAQARDEFLLDFVNGQLLWRCHWAGKIGCGRGKWKKGNAAYLVFSDNSWEIPSPSPRTLSRRRGSAVGSSGLFLPLGKRDRDGLNKAKRRRAGLPPQSTKSQLHRSGREGVAPIQVVVTR
jgi:hypothetical protein